MAIRAPDGANKDIWDILKVELRMLANANLGICFISFVNWLTFTIFPIFNPSSGEGDSPEYVYLLMVGYQLCPNGR